MANKKRALVTGVSKGLGRYCALKLKELDYKVIGLSRSPKESLDSTLLDSLHNYESLDLADSSGVEKFIQDLQEIDLLIINSSHRRFGDFANFEESDIKGLIDGSFTNQLLLMHSVLKRMLARNQGAIILVSSKAAYQGYSSGSLYCSTKSAWMAIYESVSREIANSNVALINFLPDSFTTNSGKALGAKDSVERSITKIISRPISQMKSVEVRILNPKNKLFLSLNLLKKLLRK